MDLFVFCTLAGVDGQGMVTADDKKQQGGCTSWIAEQNNSSLPSSYSIPSSCLKNFLGSLVQPFQNVQNVGWITGGVLIFLLQL